MKMNVYSICDVKAEEFGPLFLAKNDEIAFRMCKRDFKDVEFPEDFELGCVGDFDIENGELNGHYNTVCVLSELFDKESKV